MLLQDGEGHCHAELLEQLKRLVHVEFVDPAGRHTRTEGVSCCIRLGSLGTVSGEDLVLLCQSCGAVLVCCCQSGGAVLLRCCNP